MADETTISISQVIRNYNTNLPFFPPEDPDLQRLHASMQDFYAGFMAAARDCGIAEGAQSKVLESAQKTLWAFGRAGRLEDYASCGPMLELDRQSAQENLKFSRPEETFSLLERLGMPVEYRTGEGWSPGGKLKTSDALRLRSDLAPALTALAARASGSSPKAKVVYERFLRINPRAKVAREKPPLDLPPDAPPILANLTGPAAEAWKILVGCLAEIEGYAPSVEFRSIHHGMWAVNYDSMHRGRDLCGLIAQNGEMTVRMILYRDGHFYVKERLESFGEVIAGAFNRAHYYEEFEHQWLFVPVRNPDDLEGVQKLLAVMPGLL